MQLLGFCILLQELPGTEMLSAITAFPFESRDFDFGGPLLFGLLLLMQFSVFE
jgi:hypothetical protein